MSDSPSQLSRRDALKWIAGTTAGTAALPGVMAAPGETEPAPPALPMRDPINDPDYLNPVYAWTKQFTPEELKTTAVLADIILPKDNLGPAASEVGVPEFINEWCSAPYEDKREDGQVIRGGLGWLNTESFRRFEKTFVEITDAQRIEIVDDICDHTKVKPAHKVGGTFFRLFRKLTLGGYYTHSSTWKQLGYVGNISIAGDYPGVPADVLKMLDLEGV